LRIEQGVCKRKKKKIRRSKKKEGMLKIKKKNGTISSAEGRGNRSLGASPDKTNASKKRQGMKWETTRKDSPEMKRERQGLGKKTPGTSLASRGHSSATNKLIESDAKKTKKEGEKLSNRLDGGKREHMNDGKMKGNGFGEWGTYSCFREEEGNGMLGRSGCETIPRWRGGGRAKKIKEKTRRRAVRSRAKSKRRFISSVGRK